MTTNTDQCEKDATQLSFDITRQFITITLGGIGFAVGLAGASGAVVSVVLFWAILIIFGLSTLFGLLFLMHGVHRLHVVKSYNVYARGLRITSACQILLAFFGVTLLCFFFQPSSGPPQKRIEVKTEKDVIMYPHSPNENYTIKIKDGEVVFSTVEVFQN